MQTTTVEDAQARLPELLDSLAAGDVVVITRGGKPVGRLVPEPPPKGVPVIGRGKGMLVSYTRDDDHLKDFADDVP
jgi:prevent-host-death family protein